MNHEQLTKLFSVAICKAVILAFYSLPVLASNLAFAEQRKDILIIKSADSGIYTYISEFLSQRLPELCKQQCNDEKTLSIHTGLADELGSSLQPADYDLIITLGTQSKNRLETKSLNTPPATIHGMIPLQASMEDNSPNHYSLVLDQPADKILNAVKQLLGTDKPIGILYSQSSSWRLPEYELAAKNNDVSILTFPVLKTDARNIGINLKKIIPEVSSILIIPDKKIYNRTTIAQLLLTGFKNSIPFIGYSRSLAITGAIASVTTDKDLIGQDISTLAIKLLNKQNMNELQFPSSYRLVINKNILESLSIDINRSFLEADDVEVIQ